MSKSDHRRNSITELTLTNVYLYCYFVLLTPKNLCGTVGIEGRGALAEIGANPVPLKNLLLSEPISLWTFLIYF